MAPDSSTPLVGATASRRAGPAASLAEDVGAGSGSGAVASSDEESEDRANLMSLVPAGLPVPVATASVALAVQRRRAAKSAQTLGGPALNQWEAGTYQGGCWSQCGVKDGYRGKVCA